MYACKIALGALALLGFVACGGSVSPGSGQLADAATLEDQSVASPAPDASQTTFNSPADTGPAQTPDVTAYSAPLDRPFRCDVTVNSGRHMTGAERRGGSVFGCLGSAVSPFVLSDGWSCQVDDVGVVHKSVADGICNGRFTEGLVPRFCCRVGT